MHFNLFPATGLDSSLVTAVLLGLYVRFFFTESLGWVFSGLVVPGYLASVAVVLPVSAGVTVCEAVLTLLCVRGLSGILSRTQLGTPVFGRDRFLWIVVTSIGVRLFFEGVLAEPLRRLALSTWGVDPSEGFGFYGIGLVLVPLLANACWKPGLGRGLVQNLVTTALTYAALRLLLETTNLSLGSLQLSFERIALDFAASPKAYMLIVAGALIASHANLRFGWDTSGVMIPGLLCLGWFAPQRLFSTLLSSMLLAGLAAMFVRLPRVREWNIEGPRRIVLVFSLGYALEFVVLHAHPPQSVAPHDLFGMGYLLSSLLAVKIWQRRNPALVVVPAVALSLVGLVAGSLFGYALTRASAAVAVNQGPPAATRGVATCAAPTTLRNELWLARARAPRGTASDVAPRITTSELGRFEQLVRQVRARAAGGCMGLGSVRDQAAALGLSVSDADLGESGQAILLREQTDALDAVRGFGVVAILKEPRTKAVLVVNHPLDDVSDPDVVLALGRALRPLAIVFGALDRDSPRGDPISERNTPVRAAAAGLGATPISILDGTQAQARVSRLVPAALASALTSLLGPMQRTGFGAWSAELHLPTTLRSQLIVGLQPAQKSIGIPSLWLAQNVQQEPRARPTPFELRMWLEDVLRPLLRGKGAPSPGKRSRLSRAAQTLSLNMAEVVQQQAIGVSFGGTTGSDGGLVVWSDAERRHALVECASSLPGAPEIATRLAQRLEARSLLIDGRSDAAHAFSDVSRVAIALGSSLPAVLQVVAQEDAAPTTLYLPYAATWKGELLAATAALGIKPRLSETLDDRTPRPWQMLFEARTGAPAATLALSREDRARFTPALLSASDRDILARLNIPVTEQDLAERLMAVCDAPSPAPATSAWIDAWVADAQRYAAERSPALLAELATEARQLGITLEVVSDASSAEPFLVVTQSGISGAALMRPGSGTNRLTCPLAPSELATAVAAGNSALIVSQRR